MHTNTMKIEEKATTTKKKFENLYTKEKRAEKNVVTYIF